MSVKFYIFILALHLIILTVITRRKSSSPSKKIVPGCLEGGTSAFIEFITHSI